MEQVEDNVLGTPYRVQRRQNVQAYNSSKRSLFREEQKAPENVDALNADSDLGPISPLALTDQSSCDSSPGRQFVSPLVTPEKSPLIPLTNWSRELARCHDPIVTDDEGVDNDVVPETPCKKEEEEQQLQLQLQRLHSESRLITPLGSLSNNTAAPRLQRRKSLTGVMSFEPKDECTSPEIKKCSFKRRLLDDSAPFSSFKRQKSDEIAPTISRAKAALFRDSELNGQGRRNKRTMEGPAFTLTPKSFYKSNTEKTHKYDSLAWREPQKQHNKDIKKRKSLATYNLSQRKSAKKHKGGEINYGVWHGIKKPKFKRQPLQSNIINNKQNIIGQVNKIKDYKENCNSPSGTQVQNQSTQQMVKDIDPKNKFFKFIPTQNAITTDDKVKLKLALNSKDSEHLHKKAKLNGISFDTADLTVDEPDIEKSLKQSKFNNILKVLEDDWADEVCEDTMKSACNSSNSSHSRQSSIILKNVTMSPGSELSNMTSSMNIDDLPALMQKQNNNKINEKNLCATEKMTVTKFYPLFSKNYSYEAAAEGNISKKRKRSTFSWQLSPNRCCTGNQYQIDAGQKIFGATQCKECGIVYYVGDANDENAHLNYHNSYKTLKFQGWKNERVVYADTCTSSRIILVESKDSNLYWKKVNEILEIADRDLGLSDMKLSCYRDKRVYMYIRDKTILGILVAESAKKAFRIIPEFSELNCCTSETCPVKCGINVVWTAMSHRRQGIATKLVDTLRATYYYGYIMSVEDLAFSTPTPNGKKFAEKYTKTLHFKVY